MRDLYLLTMLALRYADSEQERRDYLLRRRSPVKHFGAPTRHSAIGQPRESAASAEISVPASTLAQIFL